MATKVAHVHFECDRGSDPTAMARLLLLLAALGSAWWTMGAAKEVLVLMEAPVMQWKHAKLLAGLRSGGHQVQVRTPGRGIVQLATEGEKRADALFLFANDLKSEAGDRIGTMRAIHARKPDATS